MYDKLICILCMRTIRMGVRYLCSYARMFVLRQSSNEPTHDASYKFSRICRGVRTPMRYLFVYIRAFYIFRFVVHIFTVSPFMRANCHSDDFYVCVLARRQSPKPTVIAEPCADVTGANFTIL